MCLLGRVTAQAVGRQLVVHFLPKRQPEIGVAHGMHTGEQFFRHIMTAEHQEADLAARLVDFGGHPRLVRRPTMQKRSDIDRWYDTFAHGSRSVWNMLRHYYLY